MPAGNSYRPESLAGGPQLTAGCLQLPHLAQHEARPEASLASDLRAAAASVLRSKMRN